MSQELMIVFILPIRGTKDHKIYEGVERRRWDEVDVGVLWILVAQRHLPNWDMACTSGSGISGCLTLTKAAGRAMRVLNWRDWLGNNCAMRMR